MEAWTGFPLSTGRDQSSVLPLPTETGIGMGLRGWNSSSGTTSSGPFVVGLPDSITSDQSQLVKPIGGFILVNLGCSSRE